MPTDPWKDKIEDPFSPNDETQKGWDVPLPEGQYDPKKLPGTSAGSGSGFGFPADPAAAGAAGATGAAGTGMSLMELLLKLGPVGAALLNKLMGDGGGMGMSPEFNDLLKLSTDRMKSQEPLFQAASKQAYEGLPTYAKGK